MADKGKNVMEDDGSGKPPGDDDAVLDMDNYQRGKSGRDSDPGTSVAPPKPYFDPEPVPVWDPIELYRWNLYRAAIAEFIATFVFLYITVQTVIGNSADSPGGVGTLGIAFAFGVTIFVLVYCIGGISGGHINPAITLGMFLARRVSLPRALLYVAAQISGAIAGAGLVKSYQKGYFQRFGGATNHVHHGYSNGAALVAEMVGTFILVYVVFSASDAKRQARDPFVPILAPLSIGMAVFIVHLATIPITGTGINPARSLGAAALWAHHDRSWDDHWIFWIGPILGAALAALYHQYILRALPFKILQPMMMQNRP